MPDDIPLGEGGLKALKAEREQNRRLRARIQELTSEELPQRVTTLERAMIAAANQLIDAVESKKENDNE